MTSQPPLTARDGPNGARPAERPFGLTLDPWKRLVFINADGRRFVGVEPVRLFPFSDANHWIALLDAESRELALIECLDHLPPPHRALIESELVRREFLPVLVRIESITPSTPPHEWVVETDRGKTRFLIDADDRVRSLGANRALITDADGLRYLVPDLKALDPTSRRLLERHL